jgi:multidrug transporter EmrE-like cation transporter
MIPVRLFFSILGIVLLETTSQFLARNYYDNRKRYQYFILSFFLYLPVLVLLVYSYNFASFAIANALWDSGTIIAMATLGWAYFGEKPARGEIIGMGLVIAGALTIGITSNGGKDKSKN